MQNKPNFRKAKMKLNFYSTRDYENKPRLRTPGKQTQSNPISRAANVYDSAARKYHGQYASLNFDPQ
jgi:hypothetical protein